MHLRLLGPLEIQTARGPLDIGSPRQRIVLSMLALNANRVTAVEQLIDAVWNKAPPSTARGQIQICISALRKLFVDAGRPDAIRTHSSGYLLEIGASELDSAAFAGLVALARVQADERQIVAAAATLRDALALWRGPALGGMQSDLVQRGAALWEERRLSAIEERVRLDLALGRHEEISSELTALVDQHPLRERLCGFLMLALYRSGRQAEALEVRRRTRTILVEELGIEPGRELQDLEQAILNRDRALDLRPAETAPSGPAGPAAANAAGGRTVAEPSVVPRQLPASLADFTGREHQIAGIRKLLTDQPGPAVAPYAVRIIAISGKGGVGKSSLAVRVAHELAADFPDGHLYGDLGCPVSDGGTATVLARFLRALGVSGTAVPEDAAERAELYRSMVAGKRILVVLDDASTEEQVTPLLPGSPSCTVLVTSRIRLSGLSGADFVDVDVFDADNSMELLGKIVGSERLQAEQDAALGLVELCAGLPLALRIAGARLASRPHWRISELVRRLGDESSRLDEFAHRGLELRSNIGLTYRDLTAPAQRLFRLFALIQAPDFPGWTAAALLGTSLTEAADVLESLVDAQMLDTLEQPGGAARYRFHSLIRVYAQERLVESEPPDERDAALGRLLGTWLALAEEAHRRQYGGDYSIVRGTAPRWRPPGIADAVDLVKPLDWWDNERRGLVAAIRQAAGAGLHELCWELALTTVSLFEVRGYFDDWRETSELGLAVTERAGNRTGQAAMLYSLGILHIFQKRLSDARQCFETALEIFEAEGNLPGRALSLRSLAVTDGLYGNTAVMLTRYTDALDLVRRVGDRVGEALTLRSMSRYWIEEGETDRARAMLDEALAICREVGCLRGEAQVVHQFAYLHLSADQVESARQALHRVLLIVRDMGDRIGETHALYGLGIVRYREGRPEGAETSLLYALSLARRVGERMVEGKALHTLGEISLARGNYPAAAGHLGEASRLFGELGSAFWHAKTLILLAEADAASGDLGRAAEHLERASVLLAGMDSGEAARWLAQLEANRASLLAQGPRR